MLASSPAFMWTNAKPRSRPDRRRDSKSAKLARRTRSMSVFTNRHVDVLRPFRPGTGAGSSISWEQASLTMITLQPEASSDTEPWLSRSEEHTSELQSLRHLVCRLLLEKKT